MDEKEKERREEKAGKVCLTEKELHRREMILTGNEFKTLFYIALPLLFYSSLSQIFQLVDTVIAANMSAGVVSTVSFISQIETMLLAIGSGLSMGGSILIARSYGSGDMEKVRSQISTLFFIGIITGAVILILAVPLAYPFLKLLRMPEDLIGQGTYFFIITIFGIIFQFINVIYLSIEKSRGNTKVIMYFNTLVLMVKTGLNLVVINLHKSEIVGVNTAMLLLPVATLISQATMTFIALFNMTSKKNPFRLSFKACAFKRYFLLPLASMGIPVFLEKFVFAFGKVLVNSMCASFGSTVVGALGVSNRLGGLSTNPPSSFQDAESSLVSQNLGNKNVKRALGMFYRTLFINLCISSFFFVMTCIFMDPIISVFAKGDLAFADEIHKIFFYERLDVVLVALNSSVMGLLYGFGKTKITLLINLSRLFVFRIPPLWFLMTFTNLGVPAVGISMLVSNSAAGIISGIVAIVFIRKVKREEKEKKMIKKAA